MSAEGRGVGRKRCLLHPRIRPAWSQGYASDPMRLNLDIKDEKYHAGLLRRAQVSPRQPDSMPRPRLP